MRYGVSFSAAILVIALTTACSGTSKEQPSGNIRVSAAPVVSWAGDITRMAMSLTPGSYSANLVPDPAGGQYKGTFVVPPGNYTLTVDAFADIDKDGVEELVGTGSAPVTVLDGQTAVLLIRVLDVTEPPIPVPDHSPIIVSATATVSSVLVGNPVALAVQAVDVDGDPISYAWTQTCQRANGVFSAPDAASTDWTPSAAGGCILRIDVTANGKTDTAMLEVSAFSESTGEGAISVNAEFIIHPFIRSVSITGIDGSWSVARTGDDATVPFDVTPGTTLLVSVMAWANDGDVQSITLSDDCGGSAVVRATRDYERDFDWTAPTSTSVCVVSAAISSYGLSDTFPVALLVK